MSLARAGFTIGFLERPLVAGCLWGIVSGDMQTPLFLAAFYELLWLDLFPVGTYIAPNQLLPMLCVLTLDAVWQFSDITTLFMPIIFTLPLGILGAQGEKLQREWQTAGYNRLVRAFRSGQNVDGAATLSVLLALLQIFSLNFFLFFGLCSAISFAYGMLFASLGAPLILPHASWPLLWIFGAFGALPALRIRRSFALFAVGSLCLAFAGFFEVIF